MRELKVLKVHSDALLPRYAQETDSGLDLCSVESIILLPGERKLVHTGLAVELPPNTEAQIRPRSGLALNFGITVLNTPGTIDQGYRGEIGVILINLGEHDFNISKGMRIAQMVITPYYKVIVREVSELSDSERGNAGFGSSGLYSGEEIE